jgi:hypothetical protein
MPGTLATTPARVKDGAHPLFSDALPVSSDGAFTLSTAMTDGLRQRPPGRSASVVTGLYRLSFSLICPGCGDVVRIAAVDGGSGENGDSTRRCLVCHGPIIGRRRGAFYCSPKCKFRALRRRRRGVPQDAFPNGGSRGSVRLDQLTHAEQVAGVTAERPR